MKAAPRVLIVERSAIMRRELVGLLKASNMPTVMCRNPAEGPQMARDLKPDLIVAGLDLEKSDDLQTLKDLSKATSAPVLCLLPDSEGPTAASELARVARSAGAHDIVHLPSSNGARAKVGPLLLRKFSALRLASAPRPPASPMRPAPARRLPPKEADRSINQETAKLDRFPIFLIGSSSGGPKALEILISELPADFPGALVICQHMKAGATRAFSKRLAKHVRLPVVEVSDHQMIHAGACFIAAGGADLVFTRRRGKFVLASVPIDPDRPFHPCVDRMVESAEQCVPIDRLRAVLLTGIGQDGAESMARLHKKGVPTVAEAESTCLVFGMPAALINKGGAGAVLPVDKIGQHIRRCTDIRKRVPAKASAKQASTAIERLSERAGRTK